MIDSREASNLVLEMLAQAVAGDVDAASATLERIGANGDAGLMHGACCALAEAGTHALKRIYGDRMPDPAKGDMWVLEEMVPGTFDNDPAKAFSARFLIAYANGDTDTPLALYSAAFKSGGDQYVASVCALLADVAGLLKLALGEQAGGAR